MTRRAKAATRAPFLVVLDRPGKRPLVFAEHADRDAAVAALDALTRIGYAGQVLELRDREAAP